MYLRIKKLDSNQPIFLFDIDSTFGGSSDSFYKHTQERHDDIIKKLEENNISIRFAPDAVHLDERCLKLFAELLRASGGVAYCISSWSSNSNPEKSLKAIETIFSWYADFPDNWLIGSCQGGGGDRYPYYVKPLIEKFNLEKVVVIDDAYKLYSNQQLCLKVDGRLGFNIYNLAEAVKLLNLDVNKFNDNLAYHIQKINEKS